MADCSRCRAYDLSVSAAGWSLIALMVILHSAEATTDTNPIFSPCGDTRVQIADGFSFGLVFNSQESFFSGKSQLSPCDKRLNLYAGRIAVFRPRIDEISLLTVNASSFNPEDNGGYMVAYAGSKFGARSRPHFVSDGNHTVTSFTLVLDYKKGRLINLLWKNDECKSCKSNSFICLKNGDCAIKTTNCKHRGGKIDCSLSFQVAFSGTDKHEVVLNSWYQIAKLHQYSLYDLYSNLKNSLYNKFF